MDIHTEMSLFSGYGGFSLGLRLAGLTTRTICYVEWDKYCQQILLQRFQDDPPTLTPAPIWDDIKSFDGRPWCGVVDILSAGFPCQPHSNAGLRKGADDDRNLWPDTLRIIGEVGPGLVILENVPGILVGSDGRPPYGGTVVGEAIREVLRREKLPERPGSDLRTAVRNDPDVLEVVDEVARLVKRKVVDRILGDLAVARSGGEDTR